MAARFLKRLGLALLVLPGVGLPGAQPKVADQGPAMLQPSDSGPFAEGARIYRRACAGCHDSGTGRAAQKFVLQSMTPEAIHRALTDGVMKAQGAGLSSEQKIAVSEYLVGRKIGGARVAPLALCKGQQSQFDYRESPVFDGWGLDVRGTHSVPSARAGIDRNNVAKLKFKWAFAFPGAAWVRSQPALAGGAVYIGSQTGTVYALDRATGCVRWTFDADAEVRTSILIEPWQSGDARAMPRAWFGDALGNVYAVDAISGREVWRVSADAHPAARITGNPTLHDGVLYVPISSFEEASAAHPSYACCSFRGSVVALDAATGKERWRSWLVDEAKQLAPTRYGPAGVPVWSNPVVDAGRGLLYVATGNNYTLPVTEMSNSIVAIRLGDGAIAWHFQATKGDAWNVACAFKTISSNCPEAEGPDFDFGTGPTLARDTRGRDILLAGQKSGIAYGLDPDTGKLLWQTRLGRGGALGGVLFGMAVSRDRLFVPINDVPDGKDSDFPLSPGLYAIDVSTGKRVWSAANPDICNGKALCHHGLGAAISATPELVFAGASDGHLRIYDAADGNVLWDYDTLRAFETVNGLSGQGGAFAGSVSPIAFDGRLYVGSGYGFASKLPGNVLLVFGVK